MHHPAHFGRIPNSRLFGYALGEGVASLTNNGISGFAMLFYTQAMGLPFGMAGLAFSIASVWDAVIDPALGHITDNTRLKWGRRHPYILIGGLLTAISFYLLWTPPPAFRDQGWMLFSWAVCFNLLYRTSFSIFSVPYMALGFEICPDYHQRSNLQSLRNALNMLTNLLGPALAWSIFFKDTNDPNLPEATSVMSNYMNMGLTFMLASFVFVFAVMWATRHYMDDSRNLPRSGASAMKTFYRDSWQVLRDRHLRLILTFYCVGMTGAIFVATLQMYLYVYYMHFSSTEKTIVHGGGMIMCGLGALAASPLGRILDKKKAVCVGAVIMATANLLAGTIFLTGLLSPGDTLQVGGMRLPIAIIAFGLLNQLNWFGVGIFSTLAISMTADAAEVNELQSGKRKDGGFSAMFTFVFQLVSSLSMFVASSSLHWAGFAAGTDTQTPEALRNLVMLTFGLGCFFGLCVIPIALRYPISKAFMDRVKRELAEREGASETTANREPKLTSV